MPPRLIAPQDFFLAQVTGTGGGGYTFSEVWLNDSGTVGAKTGGRYGTSLNPGFSATGATLSTGQVVLARPADLAGGLAWELFGAVPGSTSAITVTDGTHTVAGVTQVTFAGATVGGTSPNATVTVSGSGSLSYGQTALPATFNVTARATWQNTGLAVSLPSAGTYLITAQVSSNLQSAAGTSASYSAELIAQLYDATAAAAVPNSVAILSLVFGNQTGSVGPVSQVTTVTISVQYQVTGATAIDLQVELNDLQAIVNISAPGYCQVHSLSGFGQTAVNWVRLGS